jgi:nucleoside-diphosphate-sugar epimerase
VISVYDAIDAIRVACLVRSLDGLTMMPCAHRTPTTLDLARSIAAAAGVPLRLLPCPFFVLYSGIACLRTLGIGSRGIAAGLSRLVETCEIEDDTLQRVAGWRPPCGLEEGLRRTFGS